MSKFRLLPIFWICVFTLLAGCTGFQKQQNNAPEQLLSEARGPEENRKLHTDLIREMIAQDRLYAANAHLQAQERDFGETLELRLLRAEIQRKLGRTVEAEADYKALLNTPYAGNAEHGLGLIYAAQNIELGTRHLRRAVELRPTDARIRNDLGYALMQQEKFSEARLHLATAFQLQSNAELGRNNYILVLLLTGNEAEARRVAVQTKISAKQMTELRRQAADFGAGKARAQVAGSLRPATREPLVVGSGGG